MVGTLNGSNGSQQGTMPSSSRAPAAAAGTPQRSTAPVVPTRSAARPTSVAVSATPSPATTPSKPETTPSRQLVTPKASPSPLSRIPASSLPRSAADRGPPSAYARPGLRPVNSLRTPTKNGSSPLLRKAAPSSQPATPSPAPKAPAEPRGEVASQSPVVVARPTTPAHATPVRPTPPPLAIRTEEPDTTGAEVETLRSRIRDLEVQYSLLQVEHARCRPRLDGPPRPPRNRNGHNDEQLAALLSDSEALGNAVRSMTKTQRLGFLGLVAEGTF